MEDCSSNWRESTLFRILKKSNFFYLYFSKVYIFKSIILKIYKDPSSLTVLLDDVYVAT